MIRVAAWSVLAVLVVAGLAYGTFADDRSVAVEDRVEDIASTIRCPQCRGQSAADSDSSTAQAVRAEIRDRLDAGESGDDIRSYFAGRYGDEILLTPPSSGVGSLVWILPVAVTTAAAGGLLYRLVRWQRGRW